MSDEEKKELLGENFWKDPKSFKILRGERMSILCASSVAKDVLVKFQENYVYQQVLPQRKRVYSKSVNSQHTSLPSSSQSELPADNLH